MKIIIQHDYTDWFTAQGAPNKTTNEIFQAICHMWEEAVVLSQGEEDLNTSCKMTLKCDPYNMVALALARSDGLTVERLLKMTFPNMSIDSDKTWARSNKVALIISSEGEVSSYGDLQNLAYKTFNLSDREQSAAAVKALKEAFKPMTIEHRIANLGQAIITLSEILENIWVAGAPLIPKGDIRGPVYNMKKILGEIN